MTRINIEQLRKEIRTMKPSDDLYKVIKDGLIIKGYWQDGKPSKRHIITT